MTPILECVPNISEGRNLAIVEEIADQVRQTAGVTLLDYSSDPDHNRSVLTYLGEPEAVLAATQKMARTALALIDMRDHQGLHPRIGAVDVVPFIPIRDMTQNDALAIARRFGRFLGDEGVPLYYYEDAATRPERQNLATIRKGRYEGLAAKQQRPEWIPDEGPVAFNARAGATVTGVRFPLIAFNVNLHTTDVAIARRIARAVRHSSGGLRYVKAMGLFLSEQNSAQVSMNLTNYIETPLPTVLETVRLEAARHGVAIAGTELIGAIPLGAMEEIMRHYVQTHDFTTDRIVESALL